MSSPKSSPRKKKPDHSLELALTWAAGLAVLLAGNLTLFRYYEASVGEPWFNYLLGAALLGLAVVIILKISRLRHDIKLANSQIGRIDGMDPHEFAAYVKEIMDKDGWANGKIVVQAFGAVLQLDKEGESVQVVLHTGRRKLTRDYIVTVWGYCANSMQQEAKEAGRIGIWCITNAHFTSQARREAAALGMKLVDRRALIDSLAKTPNAPFIPAGDRRR